MTTPIQDPQSRTVAEIRADEYRKRLRNMIVISVTFKIGTPRKYGAGSQFTFEYTADSSTAQASRDAVFAATKYLAEVSPAMLAAAHLESVENRRLSWGEIEEIVLDY